MNKYEVGYLAEGEPIGIYYGEDEAEAIQECKDHLASAALQGYKHPLSSRDKLKGMVAYKVEY